MPISWLSQQEAEGTEMVLLQPTRLPSGWPQSIHISGYFQGHVGIFPDVFVATKQVFLTFIFVPKPNQSISTALWQEGNRKFNLNKCKVATQLFCGIPEMYLANIYSGNWVGHRFAHSLVGFMHKDHRFRKKITLWLLLVLVPPAAGNHPSYGGGKKNKKIKKRPSVVSTDTTEIHPDIAFKNPVVSCLQILKHNLQQWNLSWYNYWYNT